MTAARCAPSWSGRDGPRATHGSHGMVSSVTGSHCQSMIVAARNPRSHMRSWTVSSVPDATPHDPASGARGQRTTIVARWHASIRVLHDNGCGLLRAQLAEPPMLTSTLPHSHRSLRTIHERDPDNVRMFTTRVIGKLSSAIRNTTRAPRNWDLDTFGVLNMRSEECRSPARRVRRLRHVLTRAEPAAVNTDD